MWKNCASLLAWGNKEKEDANIRLTGSSSKASGGAWAPVVGTSLTLEWGALVGKVGRTIVSIIGIGSGAV